MKHINNLLLFSSSSIESVFRRQQCRTISKVRLKWAKNRGLDHNIEVHTLLKAACLLKDAIINRPPSAQFLTATSLSNTHKLLGITFHTDRFIRRYPTIFEEFRHPKYPSLICFRLTEMALKLNQIEQKVYEAQEPKIVERLCKLLMMSSTRQLPISAIHLLRWDLGFPYHYDRILTEKHPDKFRIVKHPNGLLYMKLLKWIDEFAVSELQKKKELKELNDGGVDPYKRFIRGESALNYDLNFPKGYGYRKKVISWMDEFQKLPYISPYADSSGIDPKSDLMEKRNVGVIHEFLSLTVFKKTKRLYLKNLRREYNIPYKFARIVTRYPGIFYYSLKCKTSSLVLKEGYSRGRLVNRCELTKHRARFNKAMTMGLIFRKKGLSMMPELDKILKDDTVGFDELDVDSSGDEQDAGSLGDEKDAAGASGDERDAHSSGEEENESSGEFDEHEEGDSEFDDVSDED